MKKFIDRAASLIDVKSIVTFGIVGVFSYLAAVGKIDPKDFLGVVLVIITFFFAKSPTPDTSTTETKTVSTTEVK